jgi:hypothetical protein
MFKPEFGLHAYNENQSNINVNKQKVLVFNKGIGNKTET